MRKRYRWILATGLLLLGLRAVHRAEAATFDTMNVWVTPGVVTFGVQITSVTEGVGYNFGTVNLGQSTKTTQAIAVLNTGNVSEYFVMSISTTSGTGTQWVPIGAHGSTSLDVFEMQGRFLTAGAAAPDISSFGATDWIGGVAQAAGANTYAQGTNKTAGGVSRDLWLKLTMPPSISDTGGNQKTMVLTITGQGS